MCFHRWYVTFQDNIVLGCFSSVCQWSTVAGHQLYQKYQYVAPGICRDHEFLRLAPSFPACTATLSVPFVFSPLKCLLVLSSTATKGKKATISENRFLELSFEPVVERLRSCRSGFEKREVINAFKKTTNKMMDVSDDKLEYLPLVFTNSYCSLRGRSKNGVRIIIREAEYQKCDYRGSSRKVKFDWLVSRLSFLLTLVVRITSREGFSLWAIRKTISVMPVIYKLGSGKAYWSSLAH